jgi:hypothetical protein
MMVIMDKTRLRLDETIPDLAVSHIDVFFIWYRLV